MSRILRKQVSFPFQVYYTKFQIINENLLLSNQIPGFFDHQYIWNKATCYRIFAPITVKGR